jgi:hypothetical protein
LIVHYSIHYRLPEYQYKEAETGRRRYWRGQQSLDGQSSHRAITTKHVADIIIDDTLFNTVVITQKSIWRGYGESAALLARSQRLLGNQRCRRYIDKTFRRHNYWWHTMQHSIGYLNINVIKLQTWRASYGGVNDCAPQMSTPLYINKKFSPHDYC